MTESEKFSSSSINFPLYTLVGLYILPPPLCIFPIILKPYVMGKMTIGFFVYNSMVLVKIEYRIFGGGADVALTVFIIKFGHSY